MSEQQVRVWFEEYLVGTGMAPATIANYMADMSCFCDWLATQLPDAPLSFNGPHTESAQPTGGLGPRDVLQEGSPLLEVSTDQVRHYCQWQRLQGRSVSTINRRLQAIRKFYDFTVQAGLSLQNPARDVERLDERPRDEEGEAPLPRALTSDEVRVLLGAVGEGARTRASASLSRRDRAIVLLLLETGLKVGELVDLRMEDVVLEVGGGYVMVGQDLESGGRCLALGPETCAALRACMRVRAPAPGVDHLFVSRQGRPLSVRSVQRLVSNYAQAAGLEGVSAHTLRYTFAHDTLEETRDLAYVAQLLGLRNRTGVERYKNPQD